METLIKNAVRSQFASAIDMLENAINACPDDVWDDGTRRPCWYNAYHALFWLDLYLFGSVKGFVPPPPFNLDELLPDGPRPDPPVTKDQLLDYLRQCRKKCRTAIAELTEAKMRATHRFGWGEATGLELLLYNMRHVQHHAAQMHLILRQTTDSAPVWVTQSQ